MNYIFLFSVLAKKKLWELKLKKSKIIGTNETNSIYRMKNETKFLKGLKMKDIKLMKTIFYTDKKKS